VTLFTRVYVVYCALLKVENNLVWGRFRYYICSYHGEWAPGTRIAMQIGSLLREDLELYTDRAVS
jgi:hypothetical protein